MACLRQIKASQSKGSGCSSGHRWFSLALLALLLALSLAQLGAAQQQQLRQQAATQGSISGKQQAAPFFSIKDGKTSARRIQQQQEWKLQTTTTAAPLTTSSDFTQTDSSLNGTEGQTLSNQDQRIGTNSIPDGSTRLTMSGLTQSNADSTSPANFIQSAEQTTRQEASSTSFPQSGSTPSSMSMSLDGMIVNSRPRAVDFTGSASSFSGKNSSKRARANANNNVNKSFVRSDELSFTGQEVKASRRVPFSGVPFSSPATKGLRTRPTASNQQLSSVNSAQPAGVTSSSLFGPQASDLISGLQRDTQIRPAQLSSASRVNNPAQQFGFDEDQQQVRLSLNQLAQGMAELNGSEPASLELMRNLLAASNIQQQQGNTSPEDMLMSVMSSPDGKERRLVMIARDTLDSLQRFAAQEMRGQQQQQPQQQLSQASQKQQSAATKSRQGSGNYNRAPLKQQDEQQENNWSTNGPQSNSWSSSTFSPAAARTNEQADSAEQPVQLQVQQQQAGTTFAPFAPSSTTQQVTTTTTAIATSTSTLGSTGQDVSVTTRATNEQSEASPSKLPEDIAQQPLVIAANQNGQSSGNSRAGNSDSSFREVSVSSLSESAFDSTSSLEKRPVGAHNGGQQTVKGHNKTSGQQKIAGSSAQSSSGQQEKAASKSSLRQQQQSGSRNLQSQPQTQTQSQSQAGSSLGATNSGVKANGKKKNNAGVSGSSGSTGGSSARTETGKQTATPVTSSSPTTVTGSTSLNKQAAKTLNGNGNGKSSPSQNRDTGNSSSARSSKKTSNASGNNKKLQQLVPTLATNKQPAQNSIQLNNSKKVTATQDGAVDNSLSSNNQGESSPSSKRQEERVSNSRLTSIDISQLERKIEELERNQQQVAQQQPSSSAAASSGERSRGESVEDELDGLRAAIPGEPLMDYPIYSAPPKTSFDCMSQSCPGGYYADMETQCQVFHICQNDGRFDTFLCPNGTIFSQQHFVCVWWWQVDCQQSTTFYKLNDGIYCNSVFPSSISSSSLATSMASPSSGFSASNQQQANSRNQQGTVARVSSEANVGSFDGSVNNLNESSSPLSSTMTDNSSSSSSSPTSVDSSTGFSTTSSSSFSSTNGEEVGTQEFINQSNNSNDPKSINTDNVQDGELNQQQQQQLELLSRRA